MNEKREHRCVGCKRPYPHPLIPPPWAPVSLMLQLPWLCRRCVWWRERVEAMSHPLDVQDIRCDGHLYVIDAVSDAMSEKFADVRFFDGRHIRTLRLRYVAAIPKELRMQLPDNAIVTLS